MSKYATKEQLISIVQDMASKISVPTIGIGGGYAPIGTVISYMGVTAPQDYLACDGSTYNISAYSDLADFFESQFGSKNYFGGDGVTTFGVPTLTGAPTNAIYCIKAVNAGDIYSTNERVVGTWIDGKPLYQKTVDMGAIPSGAQNGYNMTTGLTNVDTYFVVNHFSQNGCQLPYITGTGEHGSNVAGFWYMDSTSKTPKYQLYTSSDRSGFGHLYATLRYTKTTDQEV